MRDLKVGDLLITRGSDKNRDLGDPQRSLIVLQVRDTGKPRYGVQRGTVRHYRIVEPGGAQPYWLAEVQIRAEFRLPEDP